MSSNFASIQIERSILVLDFLGIRKNISLNTNYFSIGRHPQCSLVLDSKVVSRHHATIVWVKDKNSRRNEGYYWLVDGDGRGRRSRNGVYVNGKKISSHRLVCGDVISIDSDSELIYNTISNTTENVQLPEVVFYL